MAEPTTPAPIHEAPPYDVSWLKRDVLLFAASIGCKVDELHFLYELHPSFTPFPTYPILLPFKRTDTDVVDFYARAAAATALPALPNLPPLDPKRMVDGQRRMTFRKQIPSASAASPAGFEVRSSVLGVYDKGRAGTVVETQQDLVDKASREVYCSVRGSGFYVGQGGWGGPKGGTSPAYDVPARAPDAAVRHQTGRESAHLYRLNGDYNPLHASPEAGRAMGFGGAIMHGLYSWNVAAAVVLREFGGSEAGRLREFGARFASPVRPGDALVVEMWRVGTVEGALEEVRFVVRILEEGKQEGRVVLSNGRALLSGAKEGRGGSKL